MNESRKGAGTILAVLVALIVLKGLGIFAGFLFWLIVGVLGVGFVILVSAIIISSLKGGGDEAKAEGGAEVKESPLSADQLGAIKKTKSTLSRIRVASARVNDVEIRNALTAVCAKMDKILNSLKEDPADYNTGHRVCTYYADAVEQIETKFIKLQEGGVDVDATATKMKDSLKDIDAALDKLYDSLFEDDKLDLTVEMKALEVALKRDGLLDTVQENNKE